MLMLGQRNDDSVAREFDWLGSSEQLEISPASIWIPDEDETIRQRRVTAPRPPIVEEDFDAYWSLHQSSPHVTVHDEDSFAELRPLPEINPQVSVRDEDSFAKPSALPEINPHVSVRDEDSFAKPSALPEINPHVSVRDEDSFAKPCPLPEINPHVSVRDEDSFAKPGALPEIFPHVSIGDEDSFAEPSALPAITPHVSIRDEDSFAKPGALPEINPQISIIDESHANAHETAQFAPGVCGIDESKAQPGEPSFMIVSLDGQNEKRFIQEYIGLGPSRPPELESNRPTVLKPTRAPELELSRPTVLELHSPPEPETSRRTVSPRVRVLDESQVLPSEASFATAIPSGPSAPCAHSPLEEFLVKTNMDLRTLGLATLLFVSIIGVSALVILEATTGFFSSQHVASASANQASQTAESALPQSEELPKTKPIAPVAVSKPSKQESQSMAPPREYPKFPAEVTTPMSLEGSVSDLSRKPNSNVRANDVMAEKANNKSAGKSASRSTSSREHEKHAASSKDMRANSKDNVARKKTRESDSRHSTSSQRRNEVNKSHSKTAVRKPLSASPRDAAVTKPKAEIKVPSASNGAQRPRTVTRSSGPGQ